MACSFSYLISCLWFCLALTKAYYCDSNIDDDNLDPSFAPKSFLVQADHRLAVSCIWKTNFLLHPSTRHRLAASSPNCYWLLPWLAGDIQANPGPVRFPCRRCDRPVKCNQKGIQCDVCYDWLHVRCINMSESQSTIFWVTLILPGAVQTAGVKPCSTMMLVAFLTFLLVLHLNLSISLSFTVTPPILLPLPAL